MVHLRLYVNAMNHTHFLSTSNEDKFWVSNFKVAHFLAEVKMNTDTK
jgi:hypothetical protein